MPSETLVQIIVILIPAADCVLLLHQLVIGPVIVHFNVMVFKCRHCITSTVLNVLQTECVIVFKLGFEPGSLIQQAGSLLTKPSRLVKFA